MDIPLKFDLKSINKEEAPSKYQTANKINQLIVCIDKLHNRITELEKLTRHINSINLKRGY